MTASAQTPCRMHWTVVTTNAQRDLTILELLMRIWQLGLGTPVTCFLASSSKDTNNCALHSRCDDPARFRYWWVVMSLVVGLAAIGGAVGFLFIKKLGPFAHKAEAGGDQSTAARPPSRDCPTKRADTSLSHLACGLLRCNTLVERRNLRGRQQLICATAGLNDCKSIGPDGCQHSTLHTLDISYKCTIVRNSFVSTRCIRNNKRNSNKHLLKV